MSLRIAYLTDERFPSVHTDCQQMVKTADALAALGCAVRFMPPRLARHWFRPRAERHANIARGFNVPGRFELADLPTWPASDLRIEKVVHGLLAPLVAARGDYDVVYTRNLLPLTVASRLGLPVLFETYRALPLSDPGAWGLVLRATHGRRFLGISTHSAYSREVLVAHGAAPETVAAIPNGFDPGDFAAVPDRDACRERLGLAADRPLAVYTGHIRPDKGVGALIDLAADVPEVRFVIVGGGPDEVARLEATVRGRALANVTLVGHVPVAKVPWYLRAGDLLLIPPTAAPLQAAGRTVLPMKTFTYLAAGRPTLAPDLPDTAGILVHERNSLRVAPDERAAAAAAVRRLVADPDLARRLGANAAQDASTYTWEGRARRLVAFIEERLAAGR